MKKIFLILALAAQIAAAAYSQHAVEEFYVHNGENIFYLRMPASEIRRILGHPDEEEKIIREHYNRPNFYVIKYHGIEFTYFDLSHKPEIVPTVVAISFKEPYQICNLNMIGRNADEILAHYGNPKTKERQCEYKYFRYNFRLEMPDHLVLQFRFNALGICDEVSLIHSNFYI